jgi:choline monooxygenase
MKDRTVPNSALDAFLPSADVIALNKPTGQAIGLPGRVYNADFFELEKVRLFPRAWCAIAFGSDIPKPGDAMGVEFGGWPLFVIRGDDGNIRVFHNVCRHRGAKVVVGRCHRKQRLVCPWHGWVYGLDGKLIRTPRIGTAHGSADPRFDSVGLDLKTIPSATWLDLVFINIAGNAPSLDKHMAPLNALLSAYDLSALEVNGTLQIEYPGNWKLAVEGAIEDYHLPLIHRQLMRGVVENEFQLHFAEKCFFATASQRAYAPSEDAGEFASRLSNLPSLVRDVNAPAQFWFGTIFPTAFFQIRPNYVYLTLIVPVAFNKTNLEFRYYFKNSVVQDREFFGVREAVLQTWKDVYLEDVDIIKNVQRNAERPDDGEIRQRFSPFWESNVLRFQQSVVKTIQD